MNNNNNNDNRDSLFSFFSVCLTKRVDQIVLNTCQLDYYYHLKPHHNLRNLNISSSPSY